MLWRRTRAFLILAWLVAALPVTSAFAANTDVSTVSTNAARPEWMPRPLAEAMVDNAYRQMLNRRPDPLGFTTYVDALVYEGRNASWLRHVFEQSQERQNVVHARWKRACSSTPVACILLLGWWAWQRRHRCRALNAVLAALILALASWTIWEKTPYLAFLLMACQVIAYLLLYLVPGFYMVRVIARRLPVDDAALYAIPVSMAIFSLIFILLQSLRAPAIAFTLVVALILFCIGSAALRAGLAPDILNLNTDSRVGLVLVVLAALMGLNFVAVGTTWPAYDIRSGTQVASRGFGDMPCDNSLQYDTANVFTKFSEPWNWGPGNWNMGDRTPLMAVQQTTMFRALGQPLTYWNYQVMGTLLNALFLLPLVRVARRVFPRPQLAHLAVATVLLNGFIFINIYYTWPKLLGAFFMLVTILLLTEQRVSAARTAAAGGTAALAVLSHPGCLLSLPMLGLFYGLRVLKQRGWRTAGCGIAFVAVFIACSMPWSLYKRAHPDINTSMLLVNYVDNRYYDEMSNTTHPFAVFLRYLHDPSVGVQFHNHAANVKNLFTNNFWDAGYAMLTGDWKNFQIMMSASASDFFYLLPSIGQEQLWLALIAIVFVLFHHRGWRQASGKPWHVTELAFALGWIFSSYAFNSFIKAGSPSNHELPYTEYVLLLTVVIGLSFSASSSLMLVAMGFSMLHFGYILFYTAEHRGFFPLEFFNVMVLAMPLLGILVAWHSDKSAVGGDFQQRICKGKTINRPSGSDGNGA